MSERFARHGALALAAKLAVTLLLLALLLRRVDWSILRERFLDLHYGTVLLAFLCFLLIAAGEISRMKAVFSVFNLSWIELTRLHVIGSFFGSFLPGQLGADVYRVHFLGRLDSNPDRSLALVVFMRLVGFSMLLAAALLGLAFHGRELWPQLSPRVPGPLLTFVALISILGILTLSTFPRTRVRLATFFRRSRQALTALTAAELLALFFLSLLVLAARMLTIDVLVRATGSSLVWTEALVVATLATLVTLIPISFAGFGLREGAVATLLVYFQVTYEDAVMVAALGRAFIVFWALAGGVWLLRNNPSALIPTARRFPEDSNGLGKGV